MTVAPGDHVDGRYRIDRRLGRSGRVFLAHDTGADRQVVFKFLPADVVATPTARARLERELQIVANLRDPHTVRVFGHGEHAGVPFIIFEFVPGEDLSAIIGRGPSTPAFTLPILYQALAALAEAHSAGIIHREICPENIRVCERVGEPSTLKLLDFGLGRPTDASGNYVTLTATGELLGIPRYTAPEAIRGEALTGACDLYSLGIVALEMLLGPEALGAGTSSPSPEAVRAALDRLPEALRPALQKMVASDPQRRYPSAQAAFTALSRVPVEHAMPRVPAPLAEHDPPPADARTPPWGLLAAGVVVVLVFSAAVVFLGDSSEPETREPRRSSGVTALLRNTTAVAEPDRVEDEEDVPKEPTRIAGTGCGLEPPFRGTDTLEVSSGALTRMSWTTTIPTGYDPTKRTPLVVLLRGFNQSSDDLLSKGGFAEVAEENGFLVVAPEDDAMLPWRTDDDPGRIRDVVAAMKEHFCVDDDRVFAVGHSQGGHILDLMICDDWIKGIAFHSHRGVATARRCSERQLPFILLNPKKSPHVPFDGGENCAGQTKESVAKVEEVQGIRNHCKGPREVVFRDRTGVCYEWDCETPLQSCHLEGGHPWPGVKPLNTLLELGPCEGPEAKPFPVAARIWDFFSKI